MKLTETIRLFFQRHSTPLDRMFIAMVLFSIVLGTLLINLNTFDFHYHTVFLFVSQVSSLSWLQTVAVLLFCCLFLFYGMYIKQESPYASTFLWGIGMFSWCALGNLVLTYGIQSTPFSPIDIHLLKWDQWMGIHSTALLAWTHQHKEIHSILSTIYNSLVIELLGIPILLTLCGARKTLGIFYLAMVSTCIVGSLLYYFFPTMAPSGIIHSPYFSHEQHDTSLRFYQLHHFIQPTSTDGGMIAFPSFHVIWAVLLTYTCRAKKIFFYPMIFYNSILIVATVLLGWHYAVDVISGIVLAVGGIAFGRYVDLSHTDH